MVRFPNHTGALKKAPKPDNFLKLNDPNRMPVSPDKSTFMWYN